MSTTQAPPDPNPAADRPGPTDNPYVGPRSFRYGERLHGRDVEVAELRDVLIAQRIVLLYSPSGAGKSSLLEAGLRPELERLDFRVLPTVRVGHEVPPSFAGIEVRNRYVLSTLLSLEESRPVEQQLKPVELATITLDDYLRLTLAGDDAGSADGSAERPAAVPSSEPCLVIDQFEEVFTLDPTDQDVKQAYLAELGVALRDRGRWALVAMREDFIAQLDPHLGLIPKRFAARYRLDLLGVEGARMAMRNPAEENGRRFAPDASDRLLDDLRRMRVQRSTGVVEELGPYVEPVQLQVVCRQLWNTLPPVAEGGGEIGLADIVALGRVDDALAAFYDDAVLVVCARTGAREREVRAWFEDELVSEQGFRSQVLEGPGEHGAEVVRDLQNAHVIRADSRRGINWYEISHDRLVAPILASNVAWREANLSTLQREAPLWDAQGRPPGLLISGEVLADATRWADAHPLDLLPVDRAYLQASEAEAERGRRERAAGRRNRLLAVLSTTVGVIAVIALVTALLATRARSRTEERSQRAQNEAATAAVVKLLRSSEGSVTSLNGVEIPGTDLRYLDLNSASLGDSVLDRTDLTGADLSFSTLRDVSLTGTMLVGASLEVADLTGADLSGADLSLANMADAHVEGVDWTGATCPDATAAADHGDTCEGHLPVDGGTFSGDLVGLDLSTRTLSGVTFANADLRLTRFGDVEGVKWNDVICPNGRRSADSPDGTCNDSLSLADGDYRGVFASGVKLADEDLSGSDFRDADLSWSRFNGTSLAGADLSGADLSNAHLANLPGTDLAEAVLEVESLNGAIFTGVDLRGLDFGAADTSELVLQELVCFDRSTRWEASVGASAANCAGAEAIDLVTQVLFAPDLEVLLENVDDPSHFEYLRDIFAPTGFLPRGLDTFFDPPLNDATVVDFDDGTLSVGFGLAPDRGAIPGDLEDRVDEDALLFGSLLVVEVDGRTRVSAGSVCELLVRFEELVDFLGPATAELPPLDDCTTTIQVPTSMVVGGAVAGNG